ncbi:hypothetical protein GGI25_002770 [Coemansia spiralis]|uniref:MFS-type drug efflux transporter P55 n=2 Tax=Coemansia TaxID=4863 RepID=A0A9W8G9Z7_9FUNG|nr:major facilitator superfamily domain-containing protein [Coemansia spiralis]KAJ1993485.1 hypothetical protein EDC05_002111 [Coemansia umbellata]KAJ2625273.1 hypothetical protein GGI26_000743 [Coemansia sp. RSA 1358]KAJ2677980.1 hypothetical protein GGI25_002770 [Coemansia spiralis]
MTERKILRKKSLAQFPDSNQQEAEDTVEMCEYSSIMQHSTDNPEHVPNSNNRSSSGCVSSQSQFTVEEVSSRDNTSDTRNSCHLYHYRCSRCVSNQHIYRSPEDMTSEQHMRFRRRHSNRITDRVRPTTDSWYYRLFLRLNITMPQWMRLPWERISLESTEPLPRWAPYTIVLTLGIPYFLASLDQTILSTLTPRVANDQEELFQTSWVTSSYLASLTAFMLFYGKVASIFGPLRILLLALGIFLCGSVLTAVATTMVWLILARALAGLGAGGVIAVTQTITAQVGAWHERGQYMGILGAVHGLGTTIGPLLGGLVADNLTWRISFYINLPLVCLALLATVLMLRVTAPPQAFVDKLGRVDFFGALMLVTGLMLLLLGLTWGGRVYPWVSPIVIICISVGLMLLCVFVFVEGKLALEPIIDARLLATRNVALSVLMEMCVGAVFFNTTFNLPVYYSFTQNSSASESGLRMVPLACTVVVFSILSGWLIARYSTYRLVACAGTMLMTLGTGLLCLFDAHIRTAVQVPILLVLGSGIGSCIQSLLLTAQASVQPLDLAVTTALTTFSQMMGGILGLAFGSIVSESSTKHLLMQLIEQEPGYATDILKAQNDVDEIWSTDLPREVRKEIIATYARGLQYNFALITCLSAVAMVLAAGLQNVRPRKASLALESSSQGSSNRSNSRHGLDLRRSDQDNTTLLGW